VIAIDLVILRVKKMTIEKKCKRENEKK